MRTQSGKRKPEMHQPDPPTTIQVEPTLGCNLACAHCAVPILQERTGHGFKFMDLRVASLVAKNIGRACATHGWNPRIEFASGGEPSLNPMIADIVREFRYYLPRTSLMMTSNGAGLLRKDADLLFELFAAGLNILALDDYEEVNIVPKVVERARARGLPLGVLLYHYPADGPAGNPHHRAKPGEKRISIIQDLKKATRGTHAQLNNHAAIGGPPRLDEPGTSPRCVKPFREIQVHYDGVMGMCCHNFAREADVGSLLRRDIVDLWGNAFMQAVRRKVYHGQRTFRPCAGCDYTGVRLGLLPDRMGKMAMGRPTQEDEELIAAAVRRAPVLAEQRVQWLPPLLPKGAPRVKVWK